MLLYRVNVSSVLSDVRSADDSFEMSTRSSATVLQERIALIRAVGRGKSKQKAQLELAGRRERDRTAPAADP